MKQEFSKKWKRSKQPRKQRKYRINSPLHIKHKFLSCNLSKELREKYKRRNFPLRKGDSVKIMRGEFKGKTGKISTVNLKKIKVTVEGIQKQKKDGTKVNVYFDPSNLQIIELNLEDKEREKALKRKISEQKEKK
ncbi:MAG: 50S ribosomal protein L24 [Candidatus Pacearchaeota archaeon]